MYANRYRAIQIEQTAGKQAPNPLVEQIEQRKRAALNAVKEQLEQIAQRTQTQEQIRKEERKQVQDLVARTEILDTEIQSFKNILVKHRDLVDKFLEIAERKVSVLDDYGDENRDALLEEIDKCLAKIAKREPSVDLSKWTKREQPLHGIAGTYKSHCALNLQIMLIQKFSPYHEGRKTVSNNVVQDFSKLTGVDFEVYVANRLKEAGFESVAGTPATWDQGADLIAKRNGKTIAIQAKGCSDTVGNGAVQEIVGALKYYKADEGWVVTNSTFTASARSLAQVNNIRLIDGHDLKTLKLR